MRKIEQEMIQAIEEMRNWKKDNTEVVVYKNQYGQGLHRIEVYLHSNLIMTHCFCDAYIELSNCGWSTNTTRERLNAIMEYHWGTRPFYIKKYIMSCHYELTNGTIDPIEHNTWRVSI